MRPALGPHRLVFENPHSAHQRSGDCIATLLYTITVYQKRQDSIFMNRGLGVGGFGKKRLVFVSKEISDDS